MGYPRATLPFKNAYFIGIKGAGMTALAQVFQGRGVNVSGSDVLEEFFTDAVLKRLGVPFVEGFTSENVPLECDAVFYSTAYGGGHPEIKEARRRGIPLYTYTEGLAMVLRQGTGIGVAGTHGKTTTTAMLGKIFEEAGYDPTVIVGGKVLDWGTNARVGDSMWVIAEVDEYQNKFLEYPIRHLILTSIEYDHPDFFATPAEYEDSFRRLLKSMSRAGMVAYNERYPAVKKIVDALQSGGGPQLLPYRFPPGETPFFNLRLPGALNQENALAAATLARALGIANETITRALESFLGTARRFEIYREEPFVVIDDFAHHPKAIMATIEAARERYPERTLWAVFQPHTFSRTKALLEDFAFALRKADRVLLLDIYGSAREESGGVSSADLAERIPGALHTPTLDDAKNYLQGNVKLGDVVLMMGAGDVWRVSQALHLKVES
jgi:UDP-N-acetylmuramate--alanine ligase